MKITDRNRKDRQNSQIGNDKPKDSSMGFAHVIIPSGIDRDAYIEHVRKVGECIIKTEYGAVIRDAIIPIHSMNDIEFPPAKLSQDADNGLGSLVAWCRMPRYNKVAITGIYPSYKNMTFSGEFEKISKASDSNGTSIYDNMSIDEEGVARRSQSVSSEDGQSGPSSHEIKVSGKKSASYKQSTDGNIKEHADFSRVMTALEEIDLSVVEGSTILAFIKLLKSKKIQIDSDTIEVGSVNLEPAVKGTALEGLMNDLITALLAMTLNTPQGPTIAPPLNATMFTNIQAQLSTIKSTKVSVE